MLIAALSDPVTVTAPTVLFEPETSKTKVAFTDPTTDPPLKTLPVPESVIVVYESSLLVVVPVQLELTTLILEAVD